MAYKVMEIYRDLPKTNCGYCGKPGCLPFATSAYLENFPLSACTVLEPEKLKEMEAKLKKERESGKPREEAVVAALEHLKQKLSDMDFVKIAERGGFEYLPGPPEGLRFKFLDAPYRITRDDVISEDGDTPGVTVKVFLLIYATRANGAPEAGKWVAFRELPDTVSKAKQFEAVADKLARDFSGRIAELEAAAEKLGGRPAASESAALALKFQALPRVRIQLLFWEADEDFEARASILLDKGALAYLDQEALLFMAEAFAALMAGEDISGIVA